ncbi:hypothetical protein FRC09_020756 [Ceratobasidium sp. 395]|nr:hypothetical protein FRC09_020756 [Ceratobasidium sp. 395]
MYNLLSACAGCQKWNVSYGINQYWQSLADYEGETCVKYHSTDGRIQIQPDSGDQEWSKVAPWSSTVSDTNFNLTQALAIAAISKPTATPTKSTAPARPNLHIGAIVGGTLGGLFFLTIDLGLLVYLHRRKRHNTPEIESSEGYLQPKQATSSSFHPATRNTKPFGLYENNMVDDSDPSMTSRSSPWDEAVIATQQRIGELNEEHRRCLPAAEETRNAPTDTNNKR